MHNLTGDQIGAYFGYTITTCDINGDGLDDILIGAPMWTDFTLMGKFETGRVYVVYQDKNVSRIRIVVNKVKSTKTGIAMFFDRISSEWETLQVLSLHYVQI